MSLDPPTYLNSLQNNIRARPIPWEGAVRAGTITDSDLKKIKAVDKVRKDQRRQTVEADTEAYQSLLIGGSKGKSVLESAAKRADVIQYMLVLTGDLINGTATFIPKGYIHGIGAHRTQTFPPSPPSSSSTQTLTNPSSPSSLTALTPKTPFPSSPHPSSQP